MRFIILALALACCACTSLPGSHDFPSKIFPSEIIGSLPEPVANNAVAAINGRDGTVLYSFAGLASGKAWEDIHARAWAFDLSTGTVRQLPDVPGEEGRLAATAVALGGHIYFFGGYTVAEDGHEVSTVETYLFDPEHESYTTRAPMPVPVDDAVSLAYADRYIYLISGWQNSGNVNLVQVYDTELDSWAQATPFPGAPVFGHGGGIAGRTLIVADGVRITNDADGSRDFIMSSEVWAGEISETDPTRIRWRPLPDHPGAPLYRMAVAGSDGLNAIVFAGGSANPYNFDGMGYNGEPSEPASIVFAFDVSEDAWTALGHRDPATMDHRGLISVGGSFYIIGGMTQAQAVSADILRFEILSLDAED